MLDKIMLNRSSWSVLDSKLKNLAACDFSQRTMYEKHKALRDARPHDLN